MKLITPDGEILELDQVEYTWPEIWPTVKEIASVVDAGGEILPLSSYTRTGRSVEHGDPSPFDGVASELDEWGDRHIWSKWGYASNGKEEFIFPPTDTDGLDYFAPEIPNAEE